MSAGDLGETFADGEMIIREGEVGNCMYVVQQGQVEVLVGSGDDEIQLNVLKPGAFFGEMAVFDKDVRSASVRALGEARVLTVDKKNLMRRVHEDRHADVVRALPRLGDQRQVPFVQRTHRRHERDPPRGILVDRDRVAHVPQDVPGILAAKLHGI